MPAPSKPRENPKKMYMSEELVRAVKEIIEKIWYITIATVCEDGKPWNTPVYAAYVQSSDAAGVGQHI